MQIRVRAKVNLKAEARALQSDHVETQRVREERREALVAKQIRPHEERLVRGVCLRRGGRGRAAGGRGAEAEEDRWRMGLVQRRRRGGHRGRARKRVVTARGAQSARLPLQR